MPPKNNLESQVSEETTLVDANAGNPVAENIQNIAESVPDDAVGRLVSESNTFKVGDTKTERIMTCTEAFPRTGTNAGQRMFVLNGKHWSKVKPAPEENLMVFEWSTWTDKATGLPAFGWSLLGYQTEIATLSLDEKIAKLTSVDPAYSSAIALLLK